MSDAASTGVTRTPDTLLGPQPHWTAVLEPPGTPSDLAAAVDPMPGPHRAPRRRAEPPRVAMRLDEVTKVYPNGKHALEDIDLVVPEGDFVFLVGPSGAGKSTLIKLLVRDEEPTSGIVQVAGHDLTPSSAADVPRLRRQIGIVFQDFRLLPRKTVRENVAFALEVTGAPRKQIRATVDRLLALVGPHRARRTSGPASCRAARCSAPPSRAPWSTTRG